MLPSLDYDGWPDIGAAWPGAEEGAASGLPTSLGAAQLAQLTHKNNLTSSSYLSSQIAKNLWLWQAAYEISIVSVLFIYKVDFATRIPLSGASNSAIVLCKITTIKFK